MPPQPDFEQEIANQDLELPMPPSNIEVETNVSEDHDFEVSVTDDNHETNELDKSINEISTDMKYACLSEGFDPPSEYHSLPPACNSSPIKSRLNTCQEQKKAKKVITETICPIEELKDEPVICTNDQASAVVDIITDLHNLSIDSQESTYI